MAVKATKREQVSLFSFKQVMYKKQGQLFQYDRKLNYHGNSYPSPQSHMQ
jgi:hypothetical protein